MNKTNDTDDSMDTNIDIDNPINYYILLIKIGSIISIILYIMVIFSYFFFKNQKNFIMEIQLYFMTSVFLGSILLLLIKEKYNYVFCENLGTILYCIFTSQEILALIIGFSCFSTMISREYLSKRKIEFRIIFFIFGLIIPGLISYFFVYGKDIIGNNHKIYCYLNFHIKNKLKTDIISFFLFDCYILFINCYFIYKIISLKQTSINKKLFSYVKWYPIINIIYKLFDGINIIYEMIINEEKYNTFSAISSILDAWHGIIYMIIYLCCSEISKGIFYFFSHFIFCCCKNKKKNTKVKKGNSNTNNLNSLNSLTNNNTLLINELLIN